MSDSRILLSKEEAQRKAEEKKNQVGITFERMSDGMLETRVATTVEHIAAFFNSSDEGPNARNKQDFGWRLTPEDLIELEELKADPNVMEKIAATYQIPVEDVADYNVLKHMAGKRFRTATVDTKAKTKDYESDYARRVREAREGKKPAAQGPTAEEKAAAKAKKDAEKKAKAEAEKSKTSQPAQTDSAKIEESTNS